MEKEYSNIDQFFNKAKEKSHAPSLNQIDQLLDKYDTGEIQLTDQLDNKKSNLKILLIMILTLSTIATAILLQLPQTDQFYVKTDHNNHVPKQLNLNQQKSNVVVIENERKKTIDSIWEINHSIVENQQIFPPSKEEVKSSRKIILDQPDYSRLLAKSSKGFGVNTIAEDQNKQQARKYLMAIPASSTKNELEKIQQHGIAMGGVDINITAVDYKKGNIRRIKFKPKVIDTKKVHSDVSIFGSTSTSHSTSIDTAWIVWQFDKNDLLINLYRLYEISYDWRSEEPSNYTEKKITIKNTDTRKDLEEHINFASEIGFNLTLKNDRYKKEKLKSIYIRVKAKEELEYSELCNECQYISMGKKSFGKVEIVFRYDLEGKVKKIYVVEDDKRSCCF